LDFETEMVLKIPQQSNFDSDKGNYYTKSTKTLRDEFYCNKSEDDYEYSYGDTTWK